MSSRTIENLFTAIDAKDTEDFLSFLAENASFKFGNAAAIVGKQNIKVAVDGFFASIQSSAHNIRSSWDAPGSIACHGDVTYTNTDGDVTKIPFANAMYLNDEGKIDEYLIHIDLAPLLQSEPR